MANITITIPNLPAFQAKLKQFPQLAAVEMNSAINKSLVSILGNIKSGANTPIGISGGSGLRDNWEIKMGNLEGTLASGVQYGTYVEFGTKPHMPPIDAITPWAVSKGIPPFAVALSILKHGTKANPFLQRSIDNTESERNSFFSDAIGAIVKQTAEI